MKAILLTTMLCISAFISFGQSYSPLSIENVLELKKSGLPSQEIITSINKYKVDFYLDRQSERNLIMGNISDEIIEAIRKNPPSGLVLTNIADGDSVQRFEVKIEGISTTFEERYLWFFCHRRDLVDMWWPQQHAVYVNPDSKSFDATVYLGELKDVGHWFEISGVWLERNEHQRITAYIELQNSLEKPTWPSMSLPEGSPSIRIQVLKNGH